MHQSPLKTNKPQAHNDKQKKKILQPSHPIETFDSIMIRGGATPFQLKDLNLSNPINGPFPERRQLEKSFPAAGGGEQFHSAGTRVTPVNHPQGRRRRDTATVVRRFDRCNCADRSFLRSFVFPSNSIFPLVS